MSSDSIIPRKWALHAHGRQNVFVKSPDESSRHVLMKAFIWALYLPHYPDLTVEIRIGDRFKPDVVSLDEWGKPRFWGEAGQVSVDKIRSLCRRYRDTHFAIAKWGQRLAPLANVVNVALQDRLHSAPFDLLCFPTDSAERFIDTDGNIHVTHEAIEWLRLDAQ
jgi:hypothetical protein